MEEDHHWSLPQQSFQELEESGEGQLVKIQPEESVASAGAQESEGKSETSQQHMAHPDMYICDDPDHIYSAR